MNPEIKKRLADMQASLPHFPQRLKNLLLLACSLLVGLLPLLLWLLLILLWYFLPVQISLDMSKVTLALLLLSPFAAGFVNCRWRGRCYTLGVGAWPAFWLWLGAAAAYTCLLARLPQPEKALAALVISLLLGIAGAMSAARLSKFAKPRPSAETAETTA